MLVGYEWSRCFNGCMIRLSLIKFKDQLIQGVSLPLSLPFFFFLIVPKGLKKDIISGKKHESTGRQRDSEGRYHFPSWVWDWDKISSLWSPVLFGYTCCIFWKKATAVLARRTLPLLSPSMGHTEWGRVCHGVLGKGSSYPELLLVAVCSAHLLRYTGMH